MKDLELMTDQELLALILPGMAPIELLREYSLTNIFTIVSEEQIGAVKGIGEAKKRTLAVVKEIIRRIQTNRRNEIVTISGPDAVFEYFNFLKHKQQEEFWVLLLDVKNHVIGSEMVSRGTISHSVADPKIIFNTAIKRMATNVILAHNHPSGDATSSKEDIHCTKKIIQAGELLDISVLDHVIVGKYGNTSMRESNDTLWQKSIFN